MKRNILIVLFAACAVLLLMTVGACQAAAQGPAGSGASAAAQDTSHSSRSMNPIKWVKKDKDKDSKNSPDSNGTRSDVEKKLTPKLQAQGLLPASSNATDACTSFSALNECVAALHASHNLGLDFNCMRAKVTGVHTNADLSGCKGSIGDKAQNLNKAIHELNPGADAKGATKNAEQQAKDDLRDLGA